MFSWPRHVAPQKLGLALGGSASREWDERPAADFTGPVLGCIQADFCKEILASKLGLARGEGVGGN